MDTNIRTYNTNIKVRMLYEYKHTYAYIQTVTLLAGESHFWTICPAVPLSVYLSRSRLYNEKMFKKIIGCYPKFIQNIQP